MSSEVAALPVPQGKAASGGTVDEMAASTVEFKADRARDAKSSLSRAGRRRVQRREHLGRRAEAASRTLWELEKGEMWDTTSAPAPVMQADETAAVWEGVQRMGPPPPGQSARGAVDELQSSEDYAGARGNGATSPP